jgi:LytS/YehU family sensor histidine kinase
VAIEAEAVADRIRLSVGDDGPGLAREPRMGVGLSNTQARLAALYGSRGSLQVRSRGEGGLVSLVEFPLRTGLAGAPGS